MKRNTKLALFLLPLALLTSCGEKTDDSLTLYKTRYSDGTYFEEISKSETDSTKVYMTVVAASNRGEGDVTFATSDFKMTIDSNEYTPLFFVKTTYSASMTVNGAIQKVYYVKESSPTETCKATEAEMENIILAFENYSETSFKLEYKGKEISSLN